MHRLEIHMSNRWTSLVAIAAFAVSAVAFAGGKKDGDGKDKKSTAEIGKPAPTFTLTGHDGKTYELANYKDKIVVLEWFNKDCPVCKAYMAGMKELAEKYAKKGVVWLGVDSTNFRTAQENAEVATEKKIPYPILSDFDGKVGHQYGAKTTPHMFIINKGTLVYAGAIDDSGGRGKAKKNYVSTALDELLAGKDVTTTSTKAFGCSVKYKK
jgi:peroxiredoxin